MTHLTKLVGMDYEIENTRRYYELLDLLISTDAFPSMRDKDSHKALHKAGVQFGHVLDDSPEYLAHTTLPRGWRKAISAYEPGVVELLDAKGALRGLIVIKFKGNKAEVFYIACRRYDVFMHIERCKNTDAVLVAARVMAGKDMMYEYRCNAVPMAQSNSAYAVAKDNAEQWLNKHFPGWRKPWKYWG